MLLIHVTKKVDSFSGQQAGQRAGRGHGFLSLSVWVWTLAPCWLWSNEQEVTELPVYWKGDIRKFI